jgi:hypothetical protein
VLPIVLVLYFRCNFLIRVDSLARMNVNFTTLPEEERDKIISSFKEQSPLQFSSFLYCFRHMETGDYLADEIISPLFGFLMLDINGVENGGERISDRDLIIILDSFAESGVQLTRFPREFRSAFFKKLEQFETLHEFPALLYGYNFFFLFIFYMFLLHLNV